MDVPYYWNCRYHRPTCTQKALASTSAWSTNDASSRLKWQCLYWSMCQWSCLDANNSLKSCTQRNRVSPHQIGHQLWHYQQQLHGQILPAQYWQTVTITWLFAYADNVEHIGAVAENCQCVQWKAVVLQSRWQIVKYCSPVECKIPLFIKEMSLV